jgi:hypothetical protein
MEKEKLNAWLCALAEGNGYDLSYSLGMLSDNGAFATA